MKNFSGNSLSKIHSCRICDSNKIIEVLDLGVQSLANSLRDNLKQKEKKFPLVLCLCKDCKTAQLSENVDPKIMFSNYLWVTGTSKSTIDYSYKFFENAHKIAGKNLKKVLELASNDGTFLIPFKNAGSAIYGIDPAKNIAKIANENNIKTFADFFGSKSYSKYRTIIGKVDLIFARNVLAHVPKPMDFVNGVEKFMHSGSIGIFEFHYSHKIIDELHYDSIYHEHYFYYSVKNIEFMLNKFNLNIFDAIKSPINSGNIAVYFSKTKKNKSNRLIKILENENKKEPIKTWKAFAKNSVIHRDQFVSCLNKYKNIVAFGSSARSSTLLNFSQIDNIKIKIIADNNPLKHNKYTAGSNIKIVSPNEIEWEKEKAVLILAWNFYAEIKKFLIKKNFRGILIKPFPSVEEFKV